MAKKWIGGDRLLALAEFLETDPRVKGHFEMDYELMQRSANGGWAALTKSKRGRPDLHTCGTVACAMGWAPHVRALRRAGLGYVKFNGMWGLSLNGEETYYADAAVQLFGISDRDRQHLFLERPGHRTPKQVARNIRRFVAKRQRELARAAAE